MIDNEDLQTALDQWCNYALNIRQLEQLHVREAMYWRDDLLQPLDANDLVLDPDDEAALAAADQLFDDAADFVLPKLLHAGWLDRQPADHYARTYATRHQAGG